VQIALARKILALRKPTVLVLMNAGAVAIDTLLDFHAETGAGAHGPAPLAIVEAFYPGPRGGEALAQGLFGQHNRWGRMPYTIYPTSFETEALMTEHDLRVEPGRTYRYYRDPTFAFGHGLSLTSWVLTTAAKDLRLHTGAQGAETVKVSVANTGPLDGDVVVTLYVAAKAGAGAGGGRRRASDGKELLTPLRRLVDFSRENDVPAGKSVEVEFKVDAETFAEYADAAGNEQGDLVSRAGEFVLLVDDGTGFGAGGGSVLSVDVQVMGANVVLSKFPAPPGH